MTRLKFIDCTLFTVQMGGHLHCKYLVCIKRSGWIHWAVLVFSQIVPDILYDFSKILIFKMKFWNWVKRAHKHLMVQIANVTRFKPFEMIRLSKFKFRKVIWFICLKIWQTQQYLMNKWIKATFNIIKFIYSEKATKFC